MVIILVWYMYPIINITFHNHGLWNTLIQLCSLHTRMLMHHNLYTTHWPHNSYKTHNLLADSETLTHQLQW